MITGLHYDREGREIDLERWLDLISDDSYRIVAFTDLGAAQISTVWMGLRTSPSDPPMTYETMVMAPDHEDLDHIGRRYPTQEEAERGHDEFVRKARAVVGDAYT